ncbi:MAG: radical SAM family heme chaperone HemW [Clostridiales bacterium]|nr:radical SAM family heme chaperone HemW [Clostridiales bacterium]
MALPDGSAPGIYIHIPFCLKKCSYCDFLSFPAGPGSGELFRSYTDALIHEMDERCGLLPAPADTIYVGGGTPTVLPLESLSRILEKSFAFATPCCEVTIEANPATISRDALAALRALGANRLSVGMQSIFDDKLKILGRAHTFGQFLESYEDALAAGFDNISLDLMYALPGQTLQEWEESIRLAASLSPRHISAYSLSIEEGTRFWDLAEAGLLQKADEDADLEMSHMAAALLGELGYEQYEISNYAQPGFWSRHNSKYWKRIPTLGLGLGAHSFAGGKRWSNTRDMKEYIDRDFGMRGLEDLSRWDEIQETVFLGLRLNEGISLQDFLDRFGESFESVFKGPLEKMEKLGAVSRAGGRLRLAPRGRDVLNAVMAEFLCQ